MKVDYIELNEPVLLIGYDWEKYGKWGNESKNIQDRKNSEIGINAIIKAHIDFNAPLSLFVLGKILEVEPLRSIFINLSKKYDEDFLDIQQHTYSHSLIKDHVDRGEGVALDRLREEIIKPIKMIKELSGRNVIGLGSAQSFYLGLQGEPKRQNLLLDCGIKFIRSDARGPGDSRPAPSYDNNGFYRGPYFYNENGNLLEIPGHGFSDNYLKHLSKMKPSDNWSVEYELHQHLIFFKTAIKEKSVFAPLNHPWSIGMKDPNAEVIKGILSYAKRKGIRVSTFKTLYDQIIGLKKK